MRFGIWDHGEKAMEQGSDFFHVRLGDAVDVVIASLLFKETMEFDWHTLTWRLESVYQD